MSCEDCLFCKMVAGQIPATKIYDDGLIFAFLDISPVSDGHTLVIPTQHVERLHDCSPEFLGRIGDCLSKISGAVTSAMRSDGYNVLCNNGRAAGQFVKHLHFHIIPRISGDDLFHHWPNYKYEQGKIEALADRIRENL